MTTVTINEPISEPIMDQIRELDRQRIATWEQNGPLDETHSSPQTKQATREMVSEMQAYPIWHAHLRFRGMDDVFIRVEMHDDKATDASICTRREGYDWDIQDLGREDRYAIEGLMHDMGWNPATGRFDPREEQDLC